MKFITDNMTDRISVLVVGKPGVGKTSLLRTISPNEKVCTISAESGLLCVRDMVKNGQVTGVVIESFKDFEECFLYLKHDAAWKAAYDWVFIDSLTEISELCFKQAKSNNPGGREKNFNVWNDYGEMFVDVIKGFRDLMDYNVVLTALETTEFDENKMRYIYPSIPWKKLQQKVAGHFDEVMYMTVVLNEKTSQYERVFYTQPFWNFPSKDRSNNLSLIEPPNLAYIKDKILSDTSNLQPSNQAIVQAKI
jgi:hypothetical protein